MKELWTNLKFAWKYAKDQKWKIIAFAFCNVLTIIISVIVPIISAYIIVKLTANQLQQVIMMAIVLFGVEILRNIIDFLCRYFAQVSYRETFTKLQLLILSKAHTHFYAALGPDRNFLINSS